MIISLHQARVTLYRLAVGLDKHSSPYIGAGEISGCLLSSVYFVNDRKVCIYIEDFMIDKQTRQIRFRLEIKSSSSPPSSSSSS